MPSPRAYLAGPDVFLPDPMAFAAKKRAICRRYGLHGVFPLDAELELRGLAPSAAGLAISRANEELIRSCQLVIANMTPFRGPSADVGTAYEMGFARALGLRVFAYTNVADDFTARTRAFVGVTHSRADGTLEDPDHLSIEAFALADNLMLAGAAAASGGVITTARRTVAREALYTDLAAFEECVIAAGRSFE